MTLVNYDPFKRLSSLADALYRCEPGFLGSENAESYGSWAPSVDIKEEEQQYLVHADIPGVDPKDIEITVEKGVLTLKGERRSKSEKTEGKVHRSERSYGSFVRRFSFPESVDVDSISASGNHGVLEITIPKKEGEKPKRIEIK